MTVMLQKYFRLASVVPRTSGAYVPYTQSVEHFPTERVVASSIPDSPSGSNKLRSTALVMQMADIRLALITK